MRKSNCFFGLVLALVLSFSFIPFASADGNPQLAAAMKDMGHKILAITTNASDASQNAASAALCANVLADIAQARGLMPPKVAALPQAQQAGQMAQYQQALDQLSAAISQLKTDLLGNNSSAVQNDLSQIDQIKTDGHNQFKN